MGIDYTHWIFWMIAAGVLRGVRSFYLEFKVGELLGLNTLETRMLDEVRREMVRKNAKPNLLMNFSMIGLMFACWNWLPPGESAVVFLFAGIVLSGLDILRECDERRALITAVPLQPLLWRLHVLTGVGFVFNIISAYQFSATGMK
jgi:hypothetical protein